VGVTPYNLNDYYEEGRVAYTRGIKREDNPYLDAERFLTWGTGWDDAQKERNVSTDREKPQQVLDN
jgi:hypothetical protein